MKFRVEGVEGGVKVTAPAHQELRLQVGSEAKTWVFASGTTGVAPAPAGVNRVFVQTGGPWYTAEVTVFPLLQAEETEFTPV